VSTTNVPEQIRRQGRLRFLQRTVLVRADILELLARDAIK
jgi:hypothetical protein